MTAMHPPSWDFIAKAIEALELALGPEYIVTALPLLWKVCRESVDCTSYAAKFMTTQLLKVRPSYPHIT
jgi:hypothetical protein